MKFNFTLVILLSAMLVLAWANAQGFPCGDEDRKIAEDNALERELKSCTKNRSNSCDIKAKYSDGSEEDLNSPDGRLCCDIGVVYTGRCKDGKCPRKYNNQVSF